ncbi:hypothetical protein [Alkalimarinus alittae]|uniref:Uncharacterized protein n=1 Tax=Alkalimarinus alittae TaxID=2961619 RepID=A0ABY6N366_9ALTE|nr:hypothetical protein [Alkalimarinus alittae]UZE96465.1 hypothetical protein NKI27_01580 [Alkalimarinus alittae]
MKTRSLLQTVVTSLLKLNIHKLLSHTLILSSFTLTAHADDLEKVLSDAFPAQSPIAFVKHASVVHTSADNQHAEKYMVLDFKVDNDILIKQQLQASIHSICSTVLTDYSLIEQLSNNGYDMISVSFDANNQYDCL